MSFDDPGKRLAYDPDEGSGRHIAIVEVGSWKELSRFQIEGFTHGFVEFSPGDGEYLLVMHGSGTKWWIVRSADGEQPAWAKCLGCMMLPAAASPGRNHDSKQLQSLRWVRPPPRSEGEREPPLVLQAVVDETLHLIDVSAFIRSFEEDGNFSLEQLNRLSTSPDGIHALAARD